MAALKRFNPATPNARASAYAAVLGGLGAFVFTAGIAEHSVRFAPRYAPSARREAFSAPDCRVSVWVIPTNEVLKIAQHTLALIRP